MNASMTNMWYRGRFLGIEFTKSYKIALTIFSKRAIMQDMKAIKHLSLISSVALISTPMFAKKTESKANLEIREVTTLEGKPEVQKPVVLDEKTSEEKKNETAPVSENANKTQTADNKERNKLYCEVIGWMSTMQNCTKNLLVSSDEKEAYIKGVRSALNDKESPAKLGEIVNEVQEFCGERAKDFEKKHQEEIKMIAEKNRKAGEEFMKNLLNKDTSIKTTASGASYKVLVEGDLKCKPTEDDIVKIYYTGKLIDGKIFDQVVRNSDEADKNNRDNKNPEKEPVEFPINGVIRGLSEGLQLMGKGGKAVFYIPDNLAYGEYDIPGIPAGSRLIFEIELVDVIKAEKAPAPVVSDNKDNKNDKNNGQDNKNSKDNEEGAVEQKANK